MSTIWERAEPYLFKAAIAAIGVAVAWGAYIFLKPRLTPYMANPLGANVVVFDVVKLANAQRAVAANLLRQDGGQADAATSLMSVRDSTRQAITAVAGEGTIVLVKQAVVNEGLPDITDAVLKKLGLPTNVPTQNATAYTLDEAPTNLGLYPQGLKRVPDSSAFKSEANEKAVP